MGGSSKKQTVGYKYYVGMHMVLHHGSADKLLRVRVDGRDAFLGSLASGSVYIDKPSLFGGESREGGVQGQLDFETGETSQMPNSYLASKLGAFVTAFRGVTAVVLRQMYMGTNPYLKAWDFRPQRIHKRFDDQVQWYDEKAEIPILPPIGYDDSFRYKLETSTASPSSPSSIIGVPFAYTQPGFDDSGWDYGLSAFGSYSGAEPATYEPVPAIRTPLRNTFYGEAIWLRKKVFLNAHPALVGDLEVIAWKNDGGWLWVNGVRVDHEPFAGTDFNYFNVRFVVPSSLLVLGENTFAYQMIEMVVSPDGVLGGSAGGSLVAFRVQATASAGDMNPAHIIRECLTDPDWGMGYQDADIDDTSFMAAADTLYDEGMGISILWDRQMPIEDFIKEIIKHIDAVLYIDRTTGKFVLRLIRGGYNAEDLLLLNEDNIIKLDGFQRTAFGELTNSVTVNYWDSGTGNAASLTVQDIALAQMQGAVINTTVQYPGFTKSAIASRVAQRDLKSLSTPLITCTIYANQDAKDLNIGDVFRLAWEDYELAPTVMRVNSIAYGDGKKNQIKITAVQDVFALPTAAFISPLPLPPVQSITPVPVSTRQVFEVPYLELVQVRGQTEIDNILAADPLAGFVGAAAIRPLSGAINARMLVDAGAGYEEIGALEFAPGAKLASAIGRTETTLPIQDGVDLDQVVLGTWLQCDSEIMAVTALSDTSITVKRGCLDTVPAPHAAGAALAFWDNYAQGDERQYASGETVKVKLQTVTGEGELPAAQAPEDAVTMSARAARPYPPGAVRINSQWFPEVIGGTEALSLSWAHRDRKQQTGQNLIGFTDGSIGPEPGTTYTLRLYGEDDALLRTETGLTGTSYTWTTEFSDEALEWTKVAALLRFDGADGQITITDETGRVWSREGSGAALEADQKKFGATSLKITDSSSDFHTAASILSSSDIFTIEGWFYLLGAPFTGASLAQEHPLVTQGIYAANGAFGLSVDWVTKKLIMDFRGGDAAGGFATGITVISTGQWYHFALTWDGTTCRGFLDGGLEFSVAKPFGWKNTGGLFRVGRMYEGVPSWDRSINGHIDEVRIIKGVAKYTAAFTPPASQFPGPPTAALNGRIRFELESVRDGKISYQKHNISVDRTGWGYNWGKYWGGPPP